MSENVIQSSFASGELSPSLFARVDIAKYHSGAARMRNMFVDYRSGASTRPGTEFIRPAVQGFGPVRLVRFQQSVGVTYVLEFGHTYLRFISQGGSVVEPAQAIGAVHKGTSTSVDVITAGTLAPPQLIFIGGVGGVPQINNRYFQVSSVSGVTVTLMDPLTNGPVDSTDWGTFTGGGFVQRVYTINTPYASSELALLKFSQKASIMNITHPNHPPYRLQLFSATNWTLTPDVIGSTASPPTGAVAIASASGPANYKFAVTSIDFNNQESPISNIAHANGVVDMRVIDATSGTSGSILIAWLPAPGAFAYNVYTSSPSISGPVPDDAQWGFIGTTTGTNFVDANISPDFQTSPPIHNSPLDPSTGGAPFPQVSAYFQQRLFFANGGGNDVDKFWGSKPGTDLNFDVSQPSQADDEVEGKLVSLEVNEIKSMVPMPTGLIMLTTKGAWQLSGGAGGVATQGGPITPTSLVATPQAYIGANDVPPILINYDICFVQQKGSIVRDLSYNIYANIYTGNDISILSSHLFYGHQILEWAYAEEPFKIIWAVREDGVLLSLTLLKEQDLYGWARHDTLGYFRSVATVTEGIVDATYVVVDRPLPSGQIVKQIERIQERAFPFGAEDAWCVDAGVKTVSNEPSLDLFIIFQGKNVVGDSVIANVLAPGFSSNMVGWVLRACGGIARVTSFVSSLDLICTIVQPFTNLLTDDPLGRTPVSAPGTWSIDEPFDQVFSLDHLEGQQVSVLADGGVVNNLTVQNGSITLPGLVTKVIVGLGFQAQLQTMYLDLGNEQNTVQGKRKKVAALTVRVKDSRGVKAGRTFQHLVPIKELNRVTQMGQPIPLITADERIIMDPLWDVPGQICLQIDDPLPATVLGVIPEIIIGDTPK